MKLSILVCSLSNRLQNFSVIQDLVKQAEGLPVQVLYLGDNKTMTVGEKRNKLIDLAAGEFICFVDDDDRVEPDYVRTIYDAISHESHESQIPVNLVTFQASVKINNGPAKICKYSASIEGDYNTDEFYYRLPNHLMVWRKDFVEEFPEINCGEDAQFGKLMKVKIKNNGLYENYTVCEILKVLYHYDFNSNTTETQK